MNTCRLFVLALGAVIGLVVVACEQSVAIPTPTPPSIPAPTQTPVPTVAPTATAVPTATALPPTPAASGSPTLMPRSTAVPMPTSLPPTATASATPVPQPTAVPTAARPPPMPTATVIATATPQGEKTQVTEKTGNVLFVRPVGWQRKDNPDSSIVLTPPDLPPGRECELHIFSGGERGASLRESFDAGWQSLLKDLNAKVASGGEARTAQKDGYDTISAAAVLKTATGASIYAAFFVAAPGTRVEAVLFLADSEETYNKHVGAMNTLVGTVRFANLQPGQRRL